jgi:hypothetical protein
MPRGDNNGGCGRASGVAPGFMGGPLDQVDRTLQRIRPSLRVYGVTKDSTGAILGGCSVDLFYSVSKAYAGTVISDAVTGAYVFNGITLDATEVIPTFFVVAYKAGTPVFGTTVNTLTWVP